MASTQSERRYLWPGVISGIGILTFIANIPHLLSEEGSVAFVLGVFLPMGLAIGLVAAGYWLYQSDLDTELLPRVTAWVVAGIGGMGVLTVAIVLYQSVEGGVIRHLLFVVLKLLTTGGIAGALIGIYDGQQRQQQRVTEQERRRYQSLFDGSPDAIFVATVDSGEIVDANSTAEQLLGRSREDIIGMRQSELHPAANREQYRKLFEIHVDAEEAVMTELPDGSDIHVITADGESIPVEINAARFDYRGDSRFLGIFRDVSHLRTREQVLERRTEQLEVLNRVVRHDIRNDMSIVTGWLEMLDDHVDDEGEEIVDRVSSASQHVIELTKVARDYVEVVSGDSSAQLHAISLADVLETELATRRETYPDAEFDLQGDVSGIDVRANEMLSSVVRNLLNNAVQHNDKSQPTVTVAVERADDSVILRIADNGPGIPDEQKDAVFGKGEKGLDSPGTGIGLYLVKRLVDEFDGDIWIDDNDPTGAIFNVKLQRA